jgi:hypothetical protein
VPASPRSGRGGGSSEVKTNGFLEMRDVAFCSIELKVGLNITGRIGQDKSLVHDCLARRWCTFLIQPFGYIFEAIFGLTDQNVHTVFQFK